MTDYHTIRKQSENAWNQALELLHQNVTKEQEQSLQYYRCTYAIDPNDLDKCNFESNDDSGGYMDSMYRCDYFDGPCLANEDDFPFPMPGEPKQYMILYGRSSEQCESFIDYSCFNC